MSKHTTWTRRFEKACRLWQARLGLKDWNIAYAVVLSHPSHMADVTYDCSSRRALITAYINNCLGESPERAALHEVLHLVFADTVRTAGQRGEDHPDVTMDEHRAIERLLNILLEGK